ncbi:gliding motility-associated C-terminal domain-containing protein [Rubrolithibacter danxiaensis]|uniref:T9SS type B sorting domain-containing protein n=1 Tax=Rubrolithibacter danxiaensis TaxID=3390805 RepID=UPI003BF831D1
MNPYCKALLLLILVFSALSLSAATFIVSSNADAGPGTLRDALTKAAANGSSEKDFINFNLPGTTEASRTITLLTELPLVSSNLIIDGTSQPGFKLGITDAKIVITADPGYVLSEQRDYWAAFRLIQAKEVEILGLYFTGFNFNNLRNPVPFDPTGKLTYLAAILINECDRITIGKENQGNVFGNNGNSCLSQQEGIVTPSTNVKINSNYLGYLLNGEESNENEAIVLNLSNSIIGGDNPSEKNLISRFVELRGDNNLIQGNSVENIIYTSGNNNIITNNTASFLFVEYSNNFKITGNKNNASYNNGNFIWIRNSKNGVIGGNLPDEMNQVLISQGSTETGIFNENSENIQILKNNITCSIQAYKIINGTSIPDIQVLVHSATEFSGIASPNAVITIYEDNTGCEICNPVQFYQQIIADATGKWKITGSFATKKFVANATLLANSSEFTQPRVDPDPLNHTISHPTCGLNNGSIKLDELRNVLLVEWYNSSDVKLSEGAELKNVGPGTYYAKCYNGSCRIRSPDFILQNVNPSISAQSLNVKQPSCSANNGFIHGLTLVNFQSVATYKWKNQTGTTVGTALDINNLGPGKYTLSATSKGCTKTYGSVILQNIPAPVIDLSTVKIQAATCGNANGSVSNISVSGTGTLTFRWKNEQGTVISGATTKDLLNVKAGKYSLEVKDQSPCPAVLSAPVEITDLGSITISTTNVKVKPSGCNGNQGAITGIAVTGASKFEWINENGHVQLTPTADLTNATPGKYHLKASNPYCQLVSPEFEIIPPPAILSQAVVIEQPSCYLNNGAVKNLAIANFPPNPSFTWKNENGAIVGTELELKNVAPGTYTLYVSSDNCTKTYGPVIFQNQSGTAVDLSAVKVVNSTCGQANGSISNILVSGTGNLSFRWRNEQGTIISGATSKDLLNAKAGKYTLEVKDQSSCPAILSAPIEINDRGSILIDASDVKVKPLDCNGNHGAITGMAVTGASKFEWINENGHVQLTPTADLINASPGKYHLKASNPYCELLSQTFEIFPPLAFNENNLKLQNDECGHQTGSVTGLKVSGGKSPFTYTWTNEQGTTVKTSASSADLGNLASGNYTLTVTDAAGSCPIFKTFALSNIEVPLTAPAVNNTQICAPGEAVIIVNNPVAGKYRLFDALNNGNFIEENDKGIFIVKAETSKDFYISYAEGTCESERTTVKVEVSSDIKIPNTFTPNADGRNDTWLITHLENYPDIHIRIYDRYGGLVFQSIGYHTPFEGKRNGEDLAAGTYYYIIDFKKGCKLLTGSLTILR